MHALENGVGLWRKGADGAEGLVGTWESTAQSTWSSNPTAASISIDEAATPSPNSVLELKTSSYIPLSTTPTTIARQGPLTAHATNTCSECRATATTSASSSVDDVASRRQPRQPLIIAVGILCCLILVVLIVIGWLKYRRRRKIKKDLENACLRLDSNADSKDSGPFEEKTARSRSGRRLVGPTLVPDASSSMRTLLPRSGMALSNRMAQRESAARDPRYSSGTTEDCHPAFSISHGRDLPPVPPPKHRLPPKAPPSSPTLSERVSSPAREISNMRQVKMSPVSPLSDQPVSPSIGLMGARTGR